MNIRDALIALCMAVGWPALAQAPAGTFQIKALTPDTALMAAQAAMAACRAQGYQVGVAIVDRSGLTQVFLRDRFAGAHTLDVATNKAWTAASFRTSTMALASATQPGQPMSGIRSTPRMLAIGGGLVIEGGGSIYGGIGVSGGPGGDTDEACARAGIKAIADKIEF
jgi:uncharacterized protein GlcG (DUF336 family)